MSEQTEPQSNAGEQQAPAAVGKAAPPKKGTPINVDEMRDAQPLAQHEVKEMFQKASNVIGQGLYASHNTSRYAERLLEVARGLSTGPMTPFMVQQTEYALQAATKTPELRDRVEVTELTNALKALHPDVAQRVPLVREANVPQPEAIQQQQAAPAVAKAVLPPATKPTLNVDETRDEFLRNAPAVAAALRQRGKPQEAAQLEAAAKVISAAIGTQQPQLGAALKGESVSNVLKNIWDVIEKDPELKKLPQAQNLRQAGQALEGAGLLHITVRDGVIVSFVSNFADNFRQAQKAVAKPSEPRNPTVVVESAASAARAQPSVTAEQPAVVAQQSAPPTVVPAQSATPTAEAKPASLLAPEVLAKAKALYQENQSGLTQAGTGFTKEDLPAELLAKMGVKVEELEQSGQLQKLLSGQKTDLISSFSLRTEQGEAVPFAAKLVLRRDAAGAPSLQFDLPKHQLVIPEQILGKQITPQMKEQLTTHGVVPLSDGFRDGKGQTFAAYVAVDQEMNRVVAVRRDGITLPKELLGVALSVAQHQSLLEGRPTRVEAMTNSKSQLFDAFVHLDPVKRQLHFRQVVPHAPKVEEREQLAARPRVRM